ncbi:MAG: lipoate--protein ligase family protein [Anaerolineales bacterium]
MAGNRWRLILSPPAAGAENMALDEAILESVAAAKSPATLRLYAWTPPCLSLGHAQSIESVDLYGLHDLGWDLVRRPTGGRAILHTDELTYSVAGAAADPLLAGGVLPSYQRLSAGLLHGLRLLGLGAELRSSPNPAPAVRGSSPICFEVPSPFELTWAGRKLLGSAQLRRSGAVLQHGSLPLEGDLGRICSVLHLPDREAAKRSVRRAAATLEQALGRRTSWKTVAEAVAEGFREALQLDLIESSPTETELERSEQLLAVRYVRVDGTVR